jgi:methylated-DNA-[protein]-cysteine S-methyltransferase
MTTVAAAKADRQTDGPLLFAEFGTPVGVLAVVADPSDGGDRPSPGTGAVVASGFVPVAQILEDLPDHLAGRSVVADPLTPIAEVVGRYFDGDLAALAEVSVSQRGGTFTSSAWSALRAVPAGEVVSYAELAAAAGRPRASRAAGSACATNRVAPFVPCHRVVKSGGSLGNYGYGTHIKAELLRHENALTGDDSAPALGATSARPARSGIADGR